MSGPIFVDPIHDGAADPTVIWNRERREWWMFYTNRRASFPGLGKGWIHGCAIGIATSPDGVAWSYRGTVEGLDDPAHKGLNTHWAPEVIFAEGQYHMYLTYFPGAPDAFAGVARHIFHLSSPDLLAWTRHGALPLTSDKVIDAAVALCPDGLYRLWYKDEADGSSTYSATSRDLFAWTVERKVVPGKPEAFPHEGPNVFQLGGYFWLIVDEWRGQGVFRSDDAQNWTRQDGVILDAAGSDPRDRCFARHADVVPQNDHAALYYFTHPEWDEAAKPAPETARERRTTIHVARLSVVDGTLVTERDVDAVPLMPPD